MLVPNPSQCLGSGWRSGTGGRTPPAAGPRKGERAERDGSQLPSRRKGELEPGGLPGFRSAGEW